jgi:hypothetical protein
MGREAAMLENSFVNRVLHKTLWAALLPACLLWAVASAMGRPADAPSPPHASSEFPTTWQGAPLRPLALSEVEQRFARRFPGTLARFAVGPVQAANAGSPFDTSGRTDKGSDGNSVLVLRHVDKPTRMLHPAVDCYQGLGYRIAAQQLELDREQNLWRCFEATQNASGGGQRLRVCERIVDAAGRGFTDTSAWYWAAAMGQSQGPWQAITVARPL